VKLHSLDEPATFNQAHHCTSLASLEVSSSPLRIAYGAAAISSTESQAWEVIEMQLLKQAM
jgi:hypothetical protein